MMPRSSTQLAPTSTDEKPPTKPAREVEKPAADDPDTVELVARCQRDDRQAQGQLYVRYRDRVAGIAFKVLGSSDELEDAVQDIFVEIFRSIGRFKGRSSIGTWLYRVAFNVALQRAQRRRRRLARRAGPPDERQVQTSETPLRELERAESHELVYRILDGMPPKKRTVLELHEIHGLRPKEISKVMAANVLTIRTRLHYARKEFYRKVAAEEAA